MDLTDNERPPTVTSKAKFSAPVRDNISDWNSRAFVAYTIRNTDNRLWAKTEFIYYPSIQVYRIRITSENRFRFVYGSEIPFYIFRVMFYNFV